MLGAHGRGGGAQHVRRAIGARGFTGDYRGQEEAGLTTSWYRIEGPNFVAGLRVEDDQVVDTAPMFHWMLMRRDRSLAWLETYCAKRKWTLEKLL